MRSSGGARALPSAVGGPQELKEAQGLSRRAGPQALSVGRLREF